MKFLPRQSQPQTTSYLHLRNTMRRLAAGIRGLWSRPERETQEQHHLEKINEVSERSIERAMDNPLLTRTLRIARGNDRRGRARDFVSLQNLTGVGTSNMVHSVVNDAMEHHTRSLADSTHERDQMEFLAINNIMPEVDDWHALGRMREDDARMNITTANAMINTGVGSARAALERYDAAQAALADNRRSQALGTRILRRATTGIFTGAMDMLKRRSLVSSVRRMESAGQAAEVAGWQNVAPIISAIEKYYLDQHQRSDGDGDQNKEAMTAVLHSIVRNPQPLTTGGLIDFEIRGAAHTTDFVALRNELGLPADTQAVHLLDAINHGGYVGQCLRADDANSNANNIREVEDRQVTQNTEFEAALRDVDYQVLRDNLQAQAYEPVRRVPKVSKLNDILIEALENEYGANVMNSVFDGRDVDDFDDEAVLQMILRYLTTNTHALTTIGSHYYIQGRREQLIGGMLLRFINDRENRTRSPYLSPSLRENGHHRTRIFNENAQELLNGAQAFQATVNADLQNAIEESNPANFEAIITQGTNWHRRFQHLSHLWNTQGRTGANRIPDEDIAMLDVHWMRINQAHARIEEAVQAWTGYPIGSPPPADAGEGEAEGDGGTDGEASRARTQYQGQRGAWERRTRATAIPIDVLDAQITEHRNQINQITAALGGTTIDAGPRERLVEQLVDLIEERNEAIRIRGGIPGGTMGTPSPGPRVTQLNTTDLNFGDSLTAIGDRITALGAAPAVNPPDDFNTRMRNFSRSKFHRSINTKKGGIKHILSSAIKNQWSMLKQFVHNRYGGTQIKKLELSPATSNSSFSRADLRLNRETIDDCRVIGTDENGNVKVESEDKFIVVGPPTDKGHNVCVWNKPTSGWDADMDNDTMTDFIATARPNKLYRLANATFAA